MRWPSFLVPVTTRQILCARFFLFFLEDAAGLLLVVAPGGENLGRNLVVRVAYCFTNEGKLPMRDIIADR